MGPQVAQIARRTSQDAFPNAKHTVPQFDGQYLILTLLAPIICCRKMISALNDELRGVFL